METIKSEHLTIKEFPEDLRPRERLLAKSAAYLSDVELLAIILSTGTKGRTALELSQKLLQAFGGFGKLGNASAKELASAAGIGEAKATRILAAIEIGGRLAANAPDKKINISSCSSAAELLMPVMRYLEKEYFKALILDTKNQLLNLVDIAVGSLNGALIHPRELFRSAIKVGGAAVIIAHNHPSGDATPSEEDIALTKRLVDCGKLIGIDVLDHLIIGDGRYTSLKQMNYI